MTKHTYLPKTFISDKGSGCVSHVRKEVADVLKTTLHHATTKNAQTIGMLQRSHASLKQAKRIETGERRSMCPNYVSIAVLNYITAYLAIIGSKPSRVFHGRIPYNVPDLRVRIGPQKTPTPNSQVDQEILD